MKLQQVLSIAELLIDRASLITFREHPNWVYSAKSNWKCWVSTGKFILDLQKVWESTDPSPFSKYGIYGKLKTFFFLLNLLG